jgi:repressor of nif and glnA expression
LAAFLKAIGYLIPLMDAEYANYYTREVMLILIREFQSPDEEMKKIVKRADLIAQKIEAYNYMVSRGKTWEGLDDINLSIIDLQKFEDPMPALESFKKLSKFYDRMLSGYKTGK